MPKQIFDNDEELFDYGAIDELAAMGIGDRGYATVHPPMGSDDLFQDQFERRAAEIQRTPNGMQPVHVVPTKTGPWSGNPQLGIEREFTASANNEQTILKLDEWGFPQTWRVTLGLEFDRVAQTGAPQGFSVQAHILSGAGGIVQEFDVDWLNGASFPLNFNALNVIARYSRTTAIPSDLRLRVSLGRQGSGSLNTRPQLTKLFTAAAAPARSELVEIPRFATSFRLLGNGGGAIAASLFNAANSIDFHATNNTALTASLNAANALSYMGSDGGIPIPNFARFVSYDNAVGPAGVQGQMIFVLGV